MEPLNSGLTLAQFVMTFEGSSFSCFPSNSSTRLTPYAVKDHKMPEKASSLPPQHFRPLPPQHQRQALLTEQVTASFRFSPLNVSPALPVPFCSPSSLVSLPSSQCHLTSLPPDLIAT